MSVKRCLVILVGAIMLFPVVGLAVSWEKSELHEGDEAGRLSATAVDRFGRVHAVYAATVGPLDVGTTFYYRLRPSASEGFPAPDFSGAIAFLELSREGLYLAMDITDDLVIQVVFVGADGLVYLLESEDDGGTWTQTILATDAKIDTTEGGVDIASSSRSAVVYSSVDGARVVEQGALGAWGDPQSIIQGARRGVGPAIVDTPGGIDADRFNERMVVFYDDLGEELKMVRQNALGVWSSTSVITEVVNLTRPDIAFHQGEVAVSFSDLTSIRMCEFVPRAGTSGTVFSDYEWRFETVATESELDLDAGQFYGAHVPIAYDVKGDPMVAYSENAFFILVGRTLEIKTKRRVPTLGWVGDTVEVLPSVTGLGFDLTDPGGIDLVTSVNGDPALVYEQDRGDESSVIFARPNPAPWVMVEPESSSDKSNTSAPAVATGRNGEIYMVHSSVTGGGLLVGGAEMIQAPQLTIFSGGEEATVSLEDSDRPYVSWAMTVTSDGTLHLVGLQMETTAATSGDLLYFRSSAEGEVGSSSLVGEVGMAAGGPLSLGSDGRGNLYVGFLGTDGSPSVYSLNRGAVAWGEFANVPATNVVGMDMAVRNDGGVMVSYFDASARAVRVFSNMNSRSGALEAVFSTENVRSLGGADRDPIDTACVIGPDGKMRVSYIQSGDLNVALSGAIGGNAFSNSRIASGFLDGQLEVASRGDRYVIFIYTERNGGTLISVTLQDLALASRDAFLVPGSVLTSSRARQSMDVTMDANGFPVAAMGLSTSFGFLLSQDKILLVRPADALDDDNDGIPLLSEEAYCLDPDQVDLTDFLPESRISDVGTAKLLRHQFRAPDLPGIRVAEASVRYGDFLFTYEGSSDLVSWGPEIVEPDETVSFISAPQDLPDTVYCKEVGIGWFYLEAYLLNNPRRFSRLTLERER